ncbi:MAG TPA: hypothetical protein VGE62_02405 [Candidatus Paceibacterota bacterium]
MEKRIKASGPVFFDPRRILEDCKVELEPWSNDLVIEKSHMQLIAEKLHLCCKDSLAPFLGLSVSLDPVELFAKDIHFQQGIRFSAIWKQAGSPYLPLSAIFSVLNSDCHDTSGVNNLLFFDVNGKTLAYRVVYDPANQDRPHLTEALSETISKATKAKVIIPR